MTNDSISRRQFIRGSIATAFTVSAVSATHSASAEAQKLSEDDPTAQALGYRHDATSVDVEKFPKRAGDEGAKQFCNNCALYGKGEGDAAPCSIFQGKLVASKGWCNAWVTAG